MPGNPVTVPVPLPVPAPQPPPPVVIKTDPLPCGPLVQGMLGYVPRPRRQGETDDVKRIAEALGPVRKECTCADELPDHEAHWREGRLIGVKLL